MTRKRRKPRTPPAPEQSDDGYEVGYGKPPTHTRFKPGQSGNPRGRPRGSKNLATIFDRELSATVAVTEGGKRRKLSKRQVIVKRLIQKAIEGDHRATQTLLKHLEADAAAIGVASESTQSNVLDLGDDAILAAYEKIILEGAKEDGVVQTLSATEEKETKDE